MIAMIMIEAGEVSAICAGNLHHIGRLSRPTGFAGDTRLEDARQKT